MKLGEEYCFAYLNVSSFPDLFSLKRKMWFLCHMIAYKTAVLSMFGDSKGQKISKFIIIV